MHSFPVPLQASISDIIDTVVVRGSLVVFGTLSSAVRDEVAPVAVCIPTSCACANATASTTSLA